MKLLSLLPLICLLPLVPGPCLALSPGEEAYMKLAGREGEGTVIPLWPGDGIAPGDTREGIEEKVETPKGRTMRIRDVHKPSMTVVPPPEGVASTGVTILFAPGGGYGILSLPNAVDICNWAGAMGAHCALLKYRVPRNPDDPGRRIPLSDAQRAVRLLRSLADELEIDPDKILMIGSSAGGHLTFNLANNHAEKSYDPIDDADELSARPDAVILMYPAYLTNPTVSMEGDPHLHLDKLSPTRTPPVFMTVTLPDKFTSGAVNTMLLLRKAKVPAELHVYPEGGHGGCFNKYPLMEFARPAARFLADRGIFTEAMQKKGNAWLVELEEEILKRPASASVQKGPQLLVEGALGEKEWSSGDRKLAALRKPAAAVLSIWPGDGKRADDPASGLVEVLPERGDGMVRVTSVSRPTLHHWPAPNPDGRAVVVFPGGAYNMLAAQHEGTEIAEWLNGQGITAFVAKYRVPRREGLEKHAVALQDAQRAIRIVRSRAGEFGINPEKIGVLGFSAGGNLATLTVHRAGYDSYPKVDDIDKASARPDFAILIYPAYLLGEGKSEKLDPLVAPLRSRNDYPPIYMAVAADDKWATSSLHYILHLHQEKVPGELHVYASGGHGKGLRATGGPFAQWTQSCARWLDDIKHGTKNVTVD